MQIEREKVIQFNLDLLKNEEKLSFLREKRGLTKDTIQKYEIGYNKKNNRFTIPIKNIVNSYVNIRQYAPENKEYKVISWAKGYGEARIFPEKNIKYVDTIFICEGEMDCLLLNQYGYSAVTTTCGSGSWAKKWNVLFEKKKVVIVYDCDDPGRKGAKNLAKKLIDFAAKIKIIDLGLKDGEDITDYFVKYKHTKKEFTALVRKTETEDMHELIDLSKSMNAEYYDKKIKFFGIIIGKDLSPYLVPKKVKAMCTGSGTRKQCSFCPLEQKEQGLTKVFTFDRDRKTIIKMIKSNDDQISGMIKTAMGLPKTAECRHVHLDIQERQNIEDIKIIPELNNDVIDQEYVMRSCYALSVGVKTNQSYLMRGTTMADPNNQMGVHVLNNLKSTMDTVSKFQLTDDKKDQFQKLKPKDQKSLEAIQKKTDEIAKDLTYNVTNIYNREDIILASLLTYHSVMHFNFSGKHINKGWLELTVFGDTRTGKTETIKNVVKYIRAGEFLTSGENTTRSGLLGGAQQTAAGRWTLTWGKLPINDRGLLVIDECDELTKQGIIGLLSGVRSSGVAELVKIQSQRTNARTRIIFIGNPLHGNISRYSYGVQALAELFQNMQDIARVDFAVCASRKDVSPKIINKKHQEKIPHTHTSDVLHNSVMYAWNRKAENIKWASGTEDMIFDFAQELGAKYDASIPLVLDAEMRIKIARVSVALATMLHSTEKGNEENIIVQQAHVLWSVKFLQRLYDKRIMGYMDYSEQKKRTNEINDYNILDSYFNNMEQVEIFLDNDTLILSDIEDIFGIEVGKAKEIASSLRRCRALKRKKRFYIKTDSFIEYLKKKKVELSECF